LNIHRQQGAVMIEAAYVLPIVMVMIMMVIDVIVYSVDRLYANDVMADTYHLVMGEASVVSADNPKQNVVCTAGRVELNVAQVETTITNAFESIFDGLLASSVAIHTESTDGAVPEVHVITASFASQSIFLPDSFAQVFPVKAKLILSFDLGC